MVGSTLELGDDPVETVGVVGQDEVVLGGEVREEGPGRDVGGGGDLLDRGRVVPLSYEQVDGDILDPAAPVALRRIEPPL